MTPGVLSRRSPLVPLERISPSRFLSLKECPLREVWAAGDAPNLLPGSPAARLGSSIHRLLEEAGKGVFRDGGTKIETRWDELAAEAESAMKNSWLEKHFVPLRTSVANYEVRRLKAIERAKEISQLVSTSSPIAAGQPTKRCELWVTTPDGLAGGYIDQVDVTPAGPVLRDYKTGHILEPASGRGEGAVKETYEVQLKLYAAIYASTAGVWPARLELVPLQGPVREVPFTESECLELLREAREAVSSINSIIKNNSPRKAEELLAAPGPAACRYCPFRPFCAAYENARKGAMAEETWPRDIWGTVQEKRVLGNGGILLTLQPDSIGSPPVTIRGLSPSPERHPALPLLVPGSAAAAFNLRGAGQGGTFQETARTVIYCVEESVTET
jgi:RecB family exonuclease